MIAFIATALSLNSLAAYAIVAALGVALAGGAYWYIDHRGYERGYERAAVVYQAKIDAMLKHAADAATRETERQDAANNAAKEREAERIAEMQAANENLQKQNEELQREADQDPDARKPVLNAPSVRRINHVR